MRCPNCGVQATKGAADCAGCGIVFARFLEKLEREASSVERTFNPWKGRAVAAALVALWFVSFGLYYRGAIAGLRARARLASGR